MPIWTNTCRKTDAERNNESKRGKLIEEYKMRTVVSQEE